MSIYDGVGAYFDMIQRQAAMNWQVVRDMQDQRWREAQTLKADQEQAANAYSEMAKFIMQFAPQDQEDIVAKFNQAHAGDIEAGYIPALQTSPWTETTAARTIPMYKKDEAGNLTPFSSADWSVVLAGNERVPVGQLETLAKAVVPGSMRMTPEEVQKYEVGTAYSTGAETLSKKPANAAETIKAGSAVESASKVGVAANTFGMSANPNDFASAFTNIGNAVVNIERLIEVTRSYMNDPSEQSFLVLEQTLGSAINQALQTAAATAGTSPGTSDILARWAKSSGDALLLLQQNRTSRIFTMNMVSGMTPAMHSLVAQLGLQRDVTANAVERSVGAGLIRPEDAGSLRQMAQTPVAINESAAKESKQFSVGEEILPARATIAPTAIPPGRNNEDLMSSIDRMVKRLGPTVGKIQQELDADPESEFAQILRRHGVDPARSETLGLFLAGIGGAKSTSFYEEIIKSKNKLSTQQYRYLMTIYGAAASDSGIIPNSRRIPGVPFG